MFNTHKIARTKRKIIKFSFVLIKIALNVHQFECSIFNLQALVPMSQADGHEIQIKNYRQTANNIQLWPLFEEFILMTNNRIHFKFYDNVVAVLFFCIKKSFIIEKIALTSENWKLETARQQLNETLKQFEWWSIQMKWNLTHRRWFVSMKIADCCLLPTNTIFVHENRLNCN